MNNGCLKCGILSEFDICLEHQIEQADADVLKAMNRLAELKKEKENELPSSKTD